MSRYASALVLALAFASNPAWAQQTAPATTKETDTKDPEVVVLSPFIVNSGDDKGYIATSTLGGTRINTKLRDLGSAISVVTDQFLKDTGAKNNSTLLQYTTNTEVGGVAGNFGGVGNGTQISEADKLLHPNANTRVRGLDSADNTRDFFLTDIPWDSFNTDRIDIQRGANAMLFGVGSPAGIINGSLNSAKFTDSFKFENRFGSYGSLRDSVDLNFGLIKKQLGLRIAGVDDDNKYQQRPAFDHSKRIYAALRYEPKFLNNDRVRTSLKINFENGTVSANRPRSLPPIDAISPWFYTGSAVGSDGHTYQQMNRQLFDPNVAWNSSGSAGVAKSGTSIFNPWFNNAHFGQAYTYDLAQAYNANSSTPILSYSPFTTQFFGIDPTDPTKTLASPSVITGRINGLPYSQTVGVTTFSQFASGSNLPGAQFGLYHDTNITDPSVFDFYNNLMDGNNKKEWQRWKSLNADFNQTFFNDRIGYDLAYSHEDYNEGQESFLSGQGYSISIDNNSVLMDGTTNPNGGRPYVAGKGQWGNGMSFITRNAFHATVTGDVRASDFLRKGSFLEKLLGHHQFTGLYSFDQKKTENRSYARWSLDPSYASTVQPSPFATFDPATQVDYVVYIGGNLQNATSPANANLSRVMATVQPAASVSMRYFNSHWGKPTDPSAAGYVNPNAAWNYYAPADIAQTTPIVDIQAGNPANYVGWTNTNVKVLNADTGDLSKLWTAGDKAASTTNSIAASWQGFFWDQNIIATYGLRHDKLAFRNAQLNDGQVSAINSGYAIDESGLINGKPLSHSRHDYSNTTALWSAVVHMPKEVKKFLPAGTDVSLFYDHSDNWNVQSARVDILGNPIGSPKGQTTEYGVLFEALNGKVSFKINRYRSAVQAATLQGDGAGLAGGLHQLIYYEMQGAGNAAILARGIYNGRSQPWGWDYAWHDLNTGYGASPRDPLSKASDDKEKAAIASWIAQLPSQQFFDQHGANINTAALKAGDWENVIVGKDSAWLDGQGNANVESGGVTMSQNIYGVAPVATVDTISKGIEFELTAQPFENLNLSLNASKTDATRLNLSGTLSAWLEKEYAKYQSPAGDIRRWWAGDITLRQAFIQDVWGPYQNILAQEGSTAPEIRPWRFNGIATYYFDHGMLKNVNVGAGYRWQQGSIIGYGLKSYTVASQEIPDVTKPFMGKAEDAVDFWIGYERKLTKKLRWKIQLNVRNVAQKAHLVPISVQPNGDPGQYRISEGQSWTITNTFSF